MSSSTLCDSIYRILFVTGLYIIFFAVARKILKIHAQGELKKYKDFKKYLEIPLASFWDALKRATLLDTEGYRNISSAKVKIIARSLWMFIQFLALLYLFGPLVAKEIDYKHFIVVSASFFAIFFQVGNTHWNKWKHCSNLMHRAYAIEEKYFRNHSLLILAIELLNLDLWANKSFFRIFQGQLKSVGISDETIKIKDLYSKLYEKEKELLDKIDSINKSDC